MSQTAMETIDVLESDRTNSEFDTLVLPDVSFTSEWWCKIKLFHSLKNNMEWFSVKFLWSAFLFMQICKQRTSSLLAMDITLIRLGDIQNLEYTFPVRIDG